MSHDQSTRAPGDSPSAAGHSSGYSWAVVGMLWFICFFNYADRQAIFSIFPVLEQEFGFNEEQLSYIGSAFSVVYALTRRSPGRWATASRASG